MTDPIRTALEGLLRFTHASMSSRPGAIIDFNDLRRAEEVVAALAAAPPEPASPDPERPCPDGDSCPDARRYGSVHPALAAASPEPERCATCGQSRDGLKHRCWSTHFRRVREAGDGLHVTTDCHPFQPAPAAPTVEALTVGTMTAEEYREAFGLSDWMLSDMWDRDGCTEQAPPEETPLGRTGTAYDHARRRRSTYHLDDYGLAMGDRHLLLNEVRRLRNLLAAARADERTRLAGEVSALREVARIMRRHTHYEDTPGAQTTWAMSRFAGRDCLHDCLLCRALVAAGVLTLADIGAGTRAAIKREAGRTHPEGDGCEDHP